MTLSLEQRLDRLEATNAIRSLKMRYARLCDAGYPKKELGALFTEDGVWDGGEMLGVHNGRKAIEANFALMPGQVGWAQHNVISGDITVNDSCTEAQAYWHLFQPMTFNGDAVWFIGAYDDKYVKTDQGWLMSYLALEVKAVTPYEKGWAQQQFIEVSL